MVVVAVRFGREEVFFGIELDCAVAAAQAGLFLAGLLRAEELTDFLAFPRGMTTNTNEPSLHVFLRVKVKTVPVCEYATLIHAPGINPSLVSTLTLLKLCQCKPYLFTLQVWKI